jgi:hypothetical protein
MSSSSFPSRFRLLVTRVRVRNGPDVSMQVFVSDDLCSTGGIWAYRTCTTRVARRDLAAFANTPIPSDGITMQDLRTAYGNLLRKASIWLVL